MPGEDVPHAEQRTPRARPRARGIAVSPGVIVVAVAGRGLLLGVCTLAVVLAAAHSGSAARFARARASAPGPLPCATAFKRAVGGTRVALSVTCQSVGVVIVRVTFPTTVKLASQHAFAGAVCQDSTPRMWNCLFRFGVPTAAPLNGTVTFAKPLPRRRERATVTYYEQVAGELSTLPHTVDVDPDAYVETSEF